MDADNGEYVFVSGMPRQDIFLFKKSLPKGSVTITLNGESLMEGTGFTVDYEKGVVRVSDPEINKKFAVYKVCGPDTAFIDRVTETKNQTGRPQKPYVPSPDQDLTVDMNKMIGLYAAPTSDPKVFKIIKPFQSKGMEVAVAKKDIPGELKWIKRGVDYTYEEETGKITLSKEITFKENEYMLVNGIPLKENIFNLGSATQGQVKITVDDNLLREGEDFTIDYIKCLLIFLNPVVENKNYGLVKITSGEKTLLEIPGRNSSSKKEN